MSETALTRLAANAALYRVQKRELDRAIYQAATDSGLTHTQISDIVGVYSVPAVQRILRRFTDDPSQLEQAPAEIIDRHVAGLIDGDEMMNQLLNRQYSFGAPASVGGVATDAYKAGSWDDIEIAFCKGQLGEAEFRQLATRHLRRRVSVPASRRHEPLS
ncbi:MULTISPECIES: hypothetical protein [Mycolicibacterium]|uniref:Uncharacterized protein n=2 Tax=Mycolicibacterium TaxID=1866885 RepID=A0A0H5RXL0_9MYCO|nr:MULTISPECIES: hypothetical protein [Mycolicibacterium]MCV7363500.1 winged helix-turn-helix domain-containing protein [Mycolicibacterium neworleansense]NKZ12634.1 winged helix-turn-helix domain-containing protein [Mycolicibacterium septicum DSM 44393]NOP95081.1 winged helix-turn-helix domain-containing protein [Mycolicibacterium fortuitum]CRZ18840.1 hypothetical protein BN2156_05753 [Mycolicibacterium neworleansense]